MPSEKLSTLVLIMIAVSGLAVTAAALSSVCIMRAPSVVAIDYAEAYAGHTGAIAVLNVKNMASKPIRIVEIKVFVGEIYAADFLADVPPGSSFAIVLKNPPGRWRSGEMKTITVTSVFADGSLVSCIASIKVSGGEWIGEETNPIIVNSAEGETEEGAGGEGGAGGEEEGGGGSKGVVFADDFSEGLTEWRAWGENMGLVIEVSKHGKPSPCLHVQKSGGVGTLAGVAREINVNLQHPTTLSLSFDYNVHAKKEGNIFPGNLWVRVLDSSGSILVDEKVYEAYSADSGWKSATVAIPSVSGRITAIFYMQMLSSGKQDFWIDNVVLDP
ncbi:MAG: hypothetical protein QXO15_00190 [Nitrososphaerota archaeon]